jgi:hypothetical protein
MHTFDYPWRSQRGRVITQAYYFELSLRDLPAVRGSDGAVEARWIAEAELPEWRRASTMTICISSRISSASPRDLSIQYPK